jgi:hypothetical protein
MANELTVNFSLAFVKGESRVSIPSRQMQVDVSGTPKISNTQTIGTSHEAMVLGDVSSLGAMWCLNTDATNYVEIGVDVGGTFYSVIRLAPGDWGFIPRVGTSAPYARANTSSVGLEYFIWSV